MGDFKTYLNILIKYNGHDKNVVIPNGITSIGMEAFKDNNVLETVSIPESVEEIISP